MRDVLFEGPTTIGELLDEQRGKALSDIAALSSDLLLIHDPVDLEADILERWRVNPLVLDWDARTVDASEVEIPDGTHDAHLPGTRVTLLVPFSGPAGLLHMRPSTHAENPPHGAVRGGKTLLLNYFYVDIDADPATIKRGLDHEVAAVKECVSSINSDVDAFNADLSKLVHGAIKARLDKLQADAHVMAALGVPTHQKAAGGGVGIGASRSKRADIDGRAPTVRDGSMGQGNVPATKSPAKMAPRGPGRPKGPDLVQTRAEIVNTYRQLWRGIGRRPYWREVAREIGVDERTLRVARRHFDLDEGEIDNSNE